MGCGKDHFESSSVLNTRRHEGCICEVVKTIERLQSKAVRHDDECGTSCFLEPIGGLTKQGRNADTRLFMLLDEQGKPFKAVFSDKGCNFDFTPLFRVEDVFGNCCATLRAIAPIKHSGEIVDLIADHTGNLRPDKFADIHRYKKTDSCVTVDLKNFTAIQCVADVDLNIHHH